MEKIRDAAVQANNFFRVADHLAYVSYPLLRDNKLLLVIAKNLYMAGVRGMDAVIYRERFYKRIDVLPSELDLRIRVFEIEIAPRLNIKPNVAKAVKELRFILNEYKESPVAFSRKDNFVICNKDYSLVKTVDVQMLKSYILVMREFLHLVNGLVKDVRGPC